MKLLIVQTPTVLRYLVPHKDKKNYLFYIPIYIEFFLHFIRGIQNVYESFQTAVTSSLLSTELGYFEHKSIS
jgi:hypothetical protein